MKTLAEIQRQIPQLATQLDLDTDTITARILHPTITFDDRLWIDMGNKTLHLFPTPGHSRDLASIYIKEHRLLIASDTVVTGIVPAIFFNSRELEKSLKHLLNLEIDTLIAGHGPVLYGQDTITDWLKWMIRYISDVRSEVQTCLASGEMDSDAIADAIDFDKHIEGRLAKDKFSMLQRHRNTVLKIIEEEKAAL